MDKNEISALARILYEAKRDAKAVERLTLIAPSLTLDESYQVQDQGIVFRIFENERPIGFKMGFTSQAKREQMNLGSPIYGVLTDRMEIKSKEGSQETPVYSLNDQIHPKIEPEIAFYVEKEMRFPITQEEALSSCSGVSAAMEILDSRFLHFKYFSLPDVVADNCSSSHFVLSKKAVNPLEVDIGNLEMVMSINGQIAQTASSSAISGHPGNSLVQLCELLAKRGRSVPAGSIILAGAATQAVALEPGMKVQLTVQNLGEVSIEISA